MKTKLSFITTCLISMVGVIYVALWIRDLLNPEWPLFFFGGVLMCVGLYLVVWLYPKKKYDVEGNIAGMHRHALGWGAFFIYGDIVSPLRDVKVFSEAFGWHQALVIGIPVIGAILVYKLMIMSLSRGKNVIEQDASSDR